MFSKETCAWLLERADAPIRYRVLRELLGDEAAASRSCLAILWFRNG